MFGNKESLRGLVGLIFLSCGIEFGSAATVPFSWDAAASSPIPRVEGSAAVVNGKFYMFGGFINSALQATNRVDVYNPANNTWTRLADMPVAVTHLTPAVDFDTVWFVGGFVGANPGPATTNVWKYNVVSNLWSAGPPLPEARGSGGLVRLGRTLHYFGGYKPDRQTDSTNHWVLAIDGGTNWTKAAALPEGRGHLSAVVLRGKIYALGGAHGHDVSSSDIARVDIYDSVSNTWTRTNDLPFPRSQCELASFVLNNKIILIGGRNSSVDKNALPYVTEYNPDANLWCALPPMPTNLVSCAAQAVGGKIIVATGGEGSSTLPTATTRTGVLEEKWFTGPSMPLDSSEVTSCVIGNKFYIVGDSTDYTEILDLATGTWTYSTVIRPFPYHHHAGEVYNGKFYLIGSLDDNGFGKMQIYDPATDSWTVGPTAPFLSGSAPSALINGEIYVCGGCVAWISATDQLAKYNPISNTWTSLTHMPQGRHHAGSGTDGKKFYLFGGRAGAGGVVEDGSNTVQIYDPATDTWVSSDTPGSSIAPVPQMRSGSMRIPYINGEFYYIGGETLDQPGATTNGVYDRVDIYNPASNTWRLGTPMPTARHGIFPLLVSGRIYVASGALHSAYNLSSILEIYQPTDIGPFSTEIEAANGSARLRFPTASGKTYGVEKRAVFSSGWANLTNNVPGNGGAVEIPTSASGNRQFFRVNRSP